MRLNAKFSRRVVSGPIRRQQLSRQSLWFAFRCLLVKLEEHHSELEIMILLYLYWKTYKNNREKKAKGEEIIKKKKGKKIYWILPGRSTPTSSCSSSSFFSDWFSIGESPRIISRNSSTSLRCQRGAIEVKLNREQLYLF